LAVDIIQTDVFWRLATFRQKVLPSSSRLNYCVQPRHCHNFGHESGTKFFGAEDGGSRFTGNAVVTVQEGSQRHIPENRNPKIVKFYEYHTSGLELKENPFSFRYIANTDE